MAVKLSPLGLGVSVGTEPDVFRFLGRAVLDVLGHFVSLQGQLRTGEFICQDLCIV